MTGWKWHAESGSNLLKGWEILRAALTCFDHCGSWYGEYCTVEVLMCLCLELYWYCC